ncbi:MAG: MFS transporter [Promethearchaeia archaeon]
MTEDIEIPKEHVPIKMQINYGLGSFANNLLNGFVFANITFFYNQKLGLDASLLGIAWLLFGIWNTINDPIASYLIDNTRTKIGRRIPYIRYGSFLYGLTFIFCWFPLIEPGNQIGLFFNFFLVLFLLDTMFTFVGACFFSLPNEIALTAEGRAKLSIFGTIFNFFSTGLTLILPIMLLTNQKGIHPWFYPTIILIGVGCTLILFFSSFGIKENMFAQLQPHEGFIEGLKLTLKNKPFWIFMIPGFCIALIMPVISTGILYYVDYVIPGQNLEFFILTLISGVIIGMVINVMKIEKLGPKKTIIIAFLILMCGFFSLFFLGWNAVIASIPFFIIGFGLAGSLVSYPVIMGDIIDNDELITGKRREAIYGGVNAIVTKPAISLANYLYLFVIKFFGFIDPKVSNGEVIKQAQPYTALIGIMFAICIIPSIGLLISVIALKWYPLDGPEWLEKKRFIIELHEKKEKEYVKKLLEVGKLRIKQKEAKKKRKK